MRSCFIVKRKTQKRKHKHTHKHKQLLTSPSRRACYVILGNPVAHLSAGGFGTSTKSSLYIIKGEWCESRVLAPLLLANLDTDARWTDDSVISPT
jgi:hypothetical protein